MYVLSCLPINGSLERRRQRRHTWSSGWCCTLLLLLACFKQLRPQGTPLCGRVQVPTKQFLKVADALVIAGPYCQTTRGSAGWQLDHHVIKMVQLPIDGV